MNPSNPYLRSPRLFNRTESRVLVVDLQEKLVPVIHAADRLIERAQTMLQAAKLLAIPIAGTEQYPDGLGTTIETIAPFLMAPAAKKRFSSVEALHVPAAGEPDSSHTQIAVIGIETHVCVQQTVMDLLALGYQVAVPADCVGSRFEQDHQIALDRMSAEGATVTTSESLLFEWLETADAEEFKSVSKLIRNRAE